jgi:hypothetical protein
MSSVISVKKALKRGSLLVNYPVMAMVVLSSGLFLPLLNTHTDHPIGLIIIEFLICLFFVWIYWCLANTKWRIWAFENVRNVHELKRKAIEANLFFTTYSFFFNLLWVRPSDQKKIEKLQDKFEQADEFIDQKNIPSETIIYKSKIRTTFVFIALLFGVFLGIILCFTAHPFIGILLASFSGFFGIAKYKEIKESRPQIIINERGIETKAKKFRNWASIDHEKVTCEGTGNHFRYFLEYSFPGGSEKFNINHLSVEPSHLDHLLYIYRGRSDSKGSTATSDLSKKKEDLFNDFFGK